MPSSPPIHAKHRQTVPPTVLLPRWLWKPGFLSPSCDGPQCSTSFGIFERQHHCRKCGKIFCNKCSSRIAPLIDVSRLDPCTIMKASTQELERMHVSYCRVCNICWSLLPRRTIMQEKAEGNYLVLLSTLLNSRPKPAQTTPTTYALSPCESSRFDNDFVVIAPESTAPICTTTISARTRRLEHFNLQRPPRVSSGPFRALFTLLDPEAIDKMHYDEKIPAQEDACELDVGDAELLQNVVKLGGIMRWTFTRNRKAKPVVFYGVDPDKLSTY